MADVFISYSEGDASPLVEKIAVALDAAGISCWYMERDSKHGRFPEVIAKEIENCAVFLLVLNEKSNKSKHVKNEVGLAFELDKEIIPFRVDSCKLSHYMRYYFTSFTITTANPPNEKSVQDLVERIANSLGKDSTQSVFAKIINYGEYGEYIGNVIYELDETGVLTISGKGPMRAYPDVGKNAPWWDEREMISHVRILNGVSSIGAYAFDACARLTSVDVSESVTSIASYAFFGCTGLKSVSVPWEAKIGYNAFPAHTHVIRRPRK